MQRLLSSCIRSRPLTYARPCSFLISARFNSIPSRVLPPRLNNMIINIVERSSTLAASSSDVIWSERSKRTMEEVSRSPPSNAYSGRTVHNSRDLADSFRSLDGVLSRNRVRQQLRLTERHENKGAKRRRLSSERWRRQFANEVRKKVELVVKIRKRGA